MYRPDTGRGRKVPWDIDQQRAVYVRTYGQRFCKTAAQEAQAMRGLVRRARIDEAGGDMAIYGQAEGRPGSSEINAC